ncbi:MAG: DUF3800 domain-containing protein [Candidatus Binatus sp.]|jgi:hypothetical protein|uniref:DUF3800 domain-containing protein n=1 Tax=Candidatus Binatus sp. TaxID=2811406 RepID=UPI003D10B798
MLTVTPQTRQNLAHGRKHRQRASDKACLPRRGIFTGIVGKTIVRVVYSDESGVGSIKTEPLTVVTAIVLNVDKQWEPVQDALYLAEMDTPRKLLYKRQLKGSVLYGAVRKGISAASETLTEILSIPARERIGIFYGAVDRAGCLRSLHKSSKSGSPLAEYHAAFADCLDRVDTAAKIFAAGERVLWIAHRSDRQREPATTSSHFWHKIFTEVRPRPNKAPATITDEGFAALMDSLVIEPTGKKSSIVDTVYFGNAENSIALQLADVCCSTVTLHLLEKFYNWRPIVEPFYDLIRPQIMTGDIVPMFLSR